MNIDLKLSNALNGLTGKQKGRVTKAEFSLQAERNLLHWFQAWNNAGRGNVRKMRELARLISGKPGTTSNAIKQVYKDQQGEEAEARTQIETCLIERIKQLKSRRELDWGNMLDVVICDPTSPTTATQKRDPNLSLLAERAKIAFPHPEETHGRLSLKQFAELTTGEVSSELSTKKGEMDVLSRAWCDKVLLTLHEAAKQRLAELSKL